MRQCLCIFAQPAGRAGSRCIQLCVWLALMALCHCQRAQAADPRSPFVEERTSASDCAYEEVSLFPEGRRLKPPPSTPPL